MKWNKKVIFFFVFIMVCSLSINNISSAKYQLKDYLVGISNEQDQYFIKSIGGKIKHKYKYENIVHVQLTDEMANTLKVRPTIDYVEENAQVEGASQQIPWGVEKVNAIQAQTLGQTGDGIKVAVLDTGIDYSHTDLNVAGGVSFVPGVMSYFDDNGHGTHLAGIIAAQNNDWGVIGVSPAVDLYAVKVLDRIKTGTIDQVIRGIEWSRDNGINIINLSLTTTTNSKALHAACDSAYNAGVLIISAAGNNGAGKKDTITYPAKYDSVIAVGAVDQNLTRSSYSAVGSSLELMGPGDQIYSTLPNNQYGILSGTSMASAYVTGVAALAWSSHPNLTNYQIRDILKSTALTLGTANEYGYGLVDAGKAIQ